LPLILSIRTPIPTRRQFFKTPEDLEPPPQIDIPPVGQIEDAWCYAACGEMVINKCIGPGTVDQCAVASFVKWADCCQENPRVCREDGCQKSDIERIFDNWEVDFRGSDQNPIATLSLEELTSEIVDDNNPVEVAIDWTKLSGSHALVICGVLGDMVYIMDPLLEKRGWQRYDFLLGGDGEWNWDRTWAGLRKKEVS
jgi:hypothetical protein